ncbi:sodium:proton antiporter [bacterium]|nr:sodium:proton antiporter [bacterium]
MVLPFVILLVMIATGPLFFGHFWHHHYGKVSGGLGLLTVVYYLLILNDFYTLLHCLSEYVSFLGLLTPLFIASGGILIRIHKKATPILNSVILIIGAFIANLMATTGASMLLIRPFMQINKGRLKPYHIIFFIFIVSNIGGVLTPVGDPPLFLGFLKGVPFFWTATHLWHFWLIGVGITILVFFILDSRNKQESLTQNTSGKIEIIGGKNILFILGVVISIFMDPDIIKEGAFHNFLVMIKDTFHIFGLREILFFAIAFVAYKSSNKEALKENEFNFDPILEVAYLFIGIFLTMQPALALIAEFAKANKETLTVTTFFWSTGTLSSVLDNAPTYLSFLTAAMGKLGFEFPVTQEMVAEVSGSIFYYLEAISVGAVFFGAMTYIGNAPNFMVKAIAEQHGVEMPAFVQYIFKYSIPILLPIFFVIWLIFFRTVT